MRILHISTRLILGGSQENTVLSCEGQARLGHEVHLAFGPIYGPEGSLLERVEQFGKSGADTGRVIRTHVAPNLVREVHPIADRRARHELRELITSLRPQIVHTHSSKAGVLGRLAAFDLGTDRPAVVHTIHGPPFMPIDGSAVHRLKVRLNNALYILAERYAARRCDVIVSVADAMTAQFLARGIGHPDLFRTVRSGMDIEPFISPKIGETRADIRAMLGVREHDIVVGTVARLAQHKGHDDLLDALAGELQTRPELKLLWVGDGWWRERLLAKARTLNIRVHELDQAGDRTDDNPQLLLTGLVPPERIPGLVRAMDILAHPSAREGLPRTVPQALLAGVCPVAYDVDGTGEVCRDMLTGRLVRAGDVAGLRTAIIWLIEHPRERAEMAEHGRELCRTEFSATRMVEKLEEAYALAIERRGRGRIKR